MSRSFDFSFVYAWNFSLVYLVQIPQIVPGLPGNHPAQQQDGDQVGDGHEGVKDISDGPHQIQGQHRANHHHGNEYQLIGQQGPLAP